MYNSIYKCRLCKEEYIDACTDNELIASAETMGISLGIKSKRVTSPKLYDVHYCKDGSIGLADYLGFKNVP